MATFFETRAYTPYGVTNTALAPRLAFCGQYRDPFTGNYPLGNGHRFYSPTLTRFLRPDSLSPFGLGGVNAYAYCVGDPVNHIDPSGQRAEDYVLPALSILTNLAGLFISGLRFRSFYKRGVVARSAAGSTSPELMITPASAKDWITSSVSAVSAIAGFTLGIARTAKPGEEWQTWGLAVLTTVSLGTTAYEAWKLAQAKPWKVPTPVTPVTTALPLQDPQASAPSTIGAGIRLGTYNRTNEPPK
ncbi:RHS repeat-associated core domain-containing protein [Pseudomonas sp. NPDC090592]|uniref:RHS repeat-associated core domain-containing protein n=1 Tax=Pseudomonas sp. NPDC090592 TaxID=3364480 RepID=UPI00383B6EB7